MSAPIQIGGNSENVILQRLTRDADPAAWVVGGTFMVARVTGTFDSVILRPDGFVRDLENMHSTLRGKASLNGVDDDLQVQLQIEKNGQLNVEAKVTDRNHSHRTSIWFSIDQTYLYRLIGACRANGWR